MATEQANTAPTKDIGVPDWSWGQWSQGLLSDWCETSARWTPPITHPRPGLLDPHERAVALAASSAIGSQEFDAMSMLY